MLQSLHLYGYMLFRRRFSTLAPGHIYLSFNSFLASNSTTLLQPNNLSFTSLISISFSINCNAKTKNLTVYCIVLSTLKRHFGPAKYSCENIANLQPHYELLSVHKTVQRNHAPFSANWKCEWLLECNRYFDTRIFSEIYVLYSRYFIHPPYLEIGSFIF